jgi:hypothetical protein
VSEKSTMKDHHEFSNSYLWIHYIWRMINTDNSFTSESLISDLKKIRILLIVLTIAQTGYLIPFFIESKLLLEPSVFSLTKWIMRVFHFLVLGIFIWYNWTRMPISKKEKRNNTYMLVFLGILGMWFWMPNKKELKKLIEVESH